MANPRERSDQIKKCSVQLVPNFRVLVWWLGTVSVRPVPEFV